MPLRKAVGLAIADLGQFPQLLEESFLLCAQGQRVVSQSLAEGDLKTAEDERDTCGVVRELGLIGLDELPQGLGSSLVLQAGLQLVQEGQGFCLALACAGEP